MMRAAYGVPEVAEMFGISDGHIRNLVKAGTLQRVPHLGRRVLIAHTELERVFGPIPKGEAA
jgi:excisionase family DNA binding protein